MFWRRKEGEGGNVMEKDSTSMHLRLSTACGKMSMDVTCRELVLARFSLVATQELNVH